MKSENVQKSNNKIGVMSYMAVCIFEKVEYKFNVDSGD